MENKRQMTALRYALEKGVSQATVYRWIKLGLPCTTKATGMTLRPYVRLIDADKAEAWLQQRAAGKGVDA